MGVRPGLGMVREGYVETYNGELPANLPSSNAHTLKSGPSNTLSVSSYQSTQKLVEKFNLSVPKAVEQKLAKLDLEESGESSDDDKHSNFSAIRNK